ncbi:MAG: rhodanese-like domain-containing protein [Candidatus Bipolaricaulaceae bacterium]
MTRLLGFAAVLLGVGMAGLAGPRIVVTPEVYEFGAVVDGSQVKLEVTVRNDGDAPLHIQRVVPSCGCTSAPLPRDTLAPGQAVKIAISFNTTGYSRYSQPVSTTVSIHATDPSRRRVTVTIRGVVRPLAPHESAASTLLSQYALLLDLRPADAYARVHLLGAVNVPLSELDTWIPRLPRDQLIYLVDDRGELSAQAVSLLQRRGFLLARAVAGGLAGWWQALGDLFLVWGEGGARAAPGGAPQAGPSAVAPAQVAREHLFIVDVRSPTEFAVGHLAGAVNVPLSTQDELAAWADTLPRAKPGTTLHIWVVDEDGTRGCAVASYLQASGHGQARCLSGGMRAWRSQHGDRLLWTQQ